MLLEDTLPTFAINPIRFIFESIKQVRISYPQNTPIEELEKMSKQLSNLLGENYTFTTPTGGMPNSSKYIDILDKAKPASFSPILKFFSKNQIPNSTSEEEKFAFYLCQLLTQFEVNVWSDVKDHYFKNAFFLSHLKTFFPPVLRSPEFNKFNNDFTATLGSNFLNQLLRETFTVKERLETDLSNEKKITSLTGRHLNESILKFQSLFRGHLVRKQLTELKAGLKDLRQLKKDSFAAVIETELKQAGLQEARRFLFLTNIVIHGLQFYNETQNKEMLDQLSLKKIGLKGNKEYIATAAKIILEHNKLEIKDSALDSNFQTAMTTFDLELYQEILKEARRNLTPTCHP